MKSFTREKNKVPCPDGGCVSGLAMAAADPCAGSRNLKLVNGKIVTMDKKNSIVSSVTIQNGVFDNTAQTRALHEGHRSARAHRGSGPGR